MVEVYGVPGAGGGLSRLAAMLWVEGSGLSLAMGITAAQTATFYILDDGGLTAAEYTGTALPAGIACHLRLSWDSERPLQHGGYVSFHVNGTLVPPASYTGGTLPWVAFTPNQLIAGYTAGTFSTWTGSIDRTNAGSVAYNP